MKSNLKYDKKKLELDSLIEFSQLINSNLNLDFILGNILLSIMGKMLISKGLFLIKQKDEFVIKSRKGINKEIIGTKYSFEFPKMPFFKRDEIEKHYEFFTENKINYFFKIYFSNKLLGLLCIGEKSTHQELTKNEIIFIETLLNISATTIENTLKFEEIIDLNKRLDIQVQQLKSLFELSKEFNINFIDPEKTIKLLGYSLQGNFGIRDLLIFTKFNAEEFYIINKIIGDELDKFDLSILEELKNPFVLEHNLKNSLLEYLRINNYKLLIPVLNKSNDVESIVCLGEKLNKQPFSRSDIEYLESLINISAISLDNSLLFKEYLEKQKTDNEIKLAREIQNILLPQEIPSLNNYELSGKNIPALEIGGDYFDLIKLDDNRIAIVIADVSGKGLPASLLMSNIQSAIHSFFKFFDINQFSISEATKRINSLIYENTSSEKFITFFWGIIDNKNNSFIYTNAGHNPPMILKNNPDKEKTNLEKCFITLDEGGLMLGILDDFDYQSGLINFEKNDILVLYTDGITESLNTEDEEFGEERLKEIIIANRKTHPHNIINKILTEVENFSIQTRQYDDETLIVIKRVS